MRDSTFLKDFRELSARHTRGCVVLERPDLVKELVVKHHARDTTARGTAMAELEAMTPRFSQWAARRGSGRAALDVPVGVEIVEPILLRQPIHRARRGREGPRIEINARAGYRADRHSHRSAVCNEVRYSCRAAIPRHIVQQRFRTPKKNIPQTPFERNRILQLVRNYVAEFNPVPPLPFAELKLHADRVVGMIECDPVYRDYVGVLINNEMWREPIARVPYERRLLLLPKCLRVESKCPAPFDEFGLLCKQCGLCTIQDLQAEAEKLGYATLIAEGSAIVMSLIQTGNGVSGPPARRQRTSRRFTPNFTPTTAPAPCSKPTRRKPSAACAIWKTRTSRAFCAACSARFSTTWKSKAGARSRK
jgi:hypothetical protein